MPPNLRKFQYAYTYRRTIPNELRRYFDGQTVFQESLGKDYRAALIRHAELEVESNKKIAKARAALAENATLDTFLGKSRETRLERIPITPTLAGRLGAVWLNELENDLDRRRSGDLANPEVFRELSQDIDNALNHVNQALATGNVGPFQGTLDFLVEGRGYKLHATDDERQTLLYDVLRHIQTGCKIMAGRQRGELVAPDMSALPDKLPAAWEASDKKGKAKAAQIQLLCDFTPELENHLATLDRKTRTANLAIWQRLVNYCPTTALCDVTSVILYAFFEERLNAVEKPWSMKYSQRAKNVLLQAFALAKTKRLVSHNPVADLGVMPRISAVVERSRLKPRYPYSVVQLNTLFSSDWYNPDARNWSGNMGKDLGARYWIPLICLFHGLRIREPLQLLTTDITPGTVPVMAIQDDDDTLNGEDAVGARRRWKNEQTKRVVPIHPTLIELGLLEFVEVSLKRDGKGPLFPSAVPRPGGEVPLWGRSYEQAFVRFVRDTLAFGHGYGNHSFRHNLEDAMRAAEAKNVWPAGLGRAFSGRKRLRNDDWDTKLMEGSEARYGLGYLPEVMLPYVSRIQYDGLTLPPPFETWLGERPIVADTLRHNIARANVARRSSRQPTR